MESLLKIHSQLKLLGYTLEPFKEIDKNQLYDIFCSVVDSGCEFPYECNSTEEFHRQFLNQESHVYICRSSTNVVIGGFYIKANFSGRSNHIANAAYMIHPAYRGQGIGTLLIKASLHIALDLGFQAMQFNMVLSQNTRALKLYQKLGFSIAGTIPEAIRNPDNRYQDGYIMYRKLKEHTL